MALKIGNTVANDRDPVSATGSLRWNVHGDPSLRRQLTVVVYVGTPPPTSSKTRSSFASRWKAARLGSWSGSTTSVRPSRDLFSAVMDDVTPMVLGVSAVVPTMPARRSCTIVPIGPVGLANLYGVPAGSSCT